MADNIQLPITGTGTADAVCATDDVSSVHYQRMKLVDGTLGGTDAIPGDATNGLDVDVTRLPALVAGTANIGDVDIVGGTIAHDAADSGNPIKVGGRATASLSDDTMVADADRIDFVGDVDGAQISRPMCPQGDILVERISNTNGTSTASTVFGATASARNCITTIVAFNDSTTNGFVDIRDGTAGTILMTIPLPAKGGASLNFPVPLRQPTANTALAYDVSAALTTVYISFIGFKSKA